MSSALTATTTRLYASLTNRKEKQSRERVPTTNRSPPFISLKKRNTASTNSDNWRAWRERLHELLGPGRITIAEVGSIVATLLREMPGSLGDTARALDISQLQWQHPPREGSTTGPSRRELLPLPYLSWTKERYQALGRRVARGASREEGNAVFEEARLQGFNSWLFAVVVSLNAMAGATGTSQAPPVQPVWPPSAVQNQCLEQLAEAVELFLGGPSDFISQNDWGALVATYKGEIILAAKAITWEAIAPALPPKAVAGKLEAADIATGEIKRALLDPERVLLPREEWPTVLPTAKVRASKAEWKHICSQLVKYNIMSSLGVDELVYHNGAAVVNGAFGVVKEKMKDEQGNELATEILRLIINLTPSNALQRAIAGDVATLPFFGQWLAFEVREGEVIIWSAEDMKCCFYLFRLPPVWWPYFVVGGAVEGTIFGYPPGTVRWPCMCVTSMGWITAVGIIQHIHRRLAQASPPTGATLPSGE